MLAERIEDEVPVCSACGNHAQGQRLQKIAAEVRELEAEVEALKADLDNAHDGRNSEAIARCEAEDRLAQLEAREQARLSTRAYSTSPSGYGGLRTQGRWIRSGQEVDHQSLCDGDPPHIADPDCEEPR